MALTVLYNGFGIVANADSIAADGQGGSWAELGGGTISDNPDVYLSGSQSIGSKYASKTGYTYFTKTTPIDYTNVYANDVVFVWLNIAAAGAFDNVMANNPFRIVIGSGTGAAREYVIAGGLDANGWTGGWKLFAIDFLNIAANIDNTPDLTAIDTFGIWIDTDTSVRADSIFHGQVFSAQGLVIDGTPTTEGKGFEEVLLWSTDYDGTFVPASTPRAAMFQSRGDILYTIGAFLIGNAQNTVFTSYGEIVQFEKSEFWNGTAWVSSYASDLNKMFFRANGGFTTDVTLINTSFFGVDTNMLQLETDLATSFSMTGGTLKYISVLTAGSTSTFSGVVWSLCSALTLGPASYTSCSFSDGGTLTVGSTTTFTGNTVNGVTGVSSLLVADLSHATGNTLISSGSNHAVELTSIGAGSMTWNNTLSGYDVGASGSPVTPTNTGNEAIFVNVASGTLTINVADGATTPSIRSAGAIVNVVAGQKTFSFTVNPAITGYEWRIYSVDGEGAMAGAVELVGEESAIASSQQYSYSYTVDQPIAVQIISQPTHDYEEVTAYYTLVNANQSVNINLKVDINN